MNMTAQDSYIYSAYGYLFGSLQSIKNSIEHINDIDLLKKDIAETLNLAAAYLNKISTQEDYKPVNNPDDLKVEVK